MSRQRTVPAPEVVDGSLTIGPTDAQQFREPQILRLARVPIHTAWCRTVLGEFTRVVPRHFRKDRRHRESICIWRSLPVEFEEFARAGAFIEQEIQDGDMMIERWVQLSIFRV